MPSPWPYRGTLLLFAAVVAAFVVWFQRHIETYVTETLIVGGTISLWGLWKMVWSKWEEGGGDGSKDLTKKLLGNPAATRALWFAALVVTLLHIFTASIYLRFAGAPSGRDTFRVQVVEGDRVFMGPFDLHPGDVVGHPIIPSFARHKLEYQILSPRGYEPLSLPLQPWGAHDLKVPGRFKAKHQHLVVLVPDAELFSRLPLPAESSGDRYYLNVSINGRTAQLKDYSKQLVVTGASREDLPKGTEVTGDAAIRQQVTDHYAQFDIDNADEVIGGLFAASVARLGSAEADEDGVIEVEVGTWTTVDGENRTRKEFACRLQVPAEGTPQARMIGILETEECKK